MDEAFPVLDRFYQRIKEVPPPRSSRMVFEEFWARWAEAVELAKQSFDAAEADDAEAYVELGREIDTLADELDAITSAYGLDACKAGNLSGAEQLVGPAVSPVPSALSETDASAYPDVILRSFIRSCGDSPSVRKICACAVDELEETVPLEDLLQAGAAVNGGGGLSPEIRSKLTQAASSCRRA